MKRKNKISTPSYLFSEADILQAEYSNRLLRSGLVELDNKYDFILNHCDLKLSNLCLFEPGSNHKVSKAFDKLAPYINQYSEFILKHEFCGQGNYKSNLNIAKLPHTYYTELDNAADAHINFFTHFDNKKIGELNKVLKALKLAFKKHQSFSIAVKIKAVIDNIKALAFRFLSFSEHLIRKVKQKITANFARNLRLLYRRVVQFHFKNLDDEEYSDIVVMHTSTTNFFTVNHIRYDVQRESNYCFK